MVVAPLWQILLELVLVYVAPATLAGGVSFWLTRSLRGWKLMIVIVGCGLAIPLLLRICYLWEIYTHSIHKLTDDTDADVAEMYMADLYWIVETTFLCMGGAIIGALIRRRAHGSR